MNDLERVKGIEPSFSNAPRRRTRSTREKDGYKRPKTKAYVCENMCDFFCTFPVADNVMAYLVRDARSRSPYWYGVYLVVSPGGQRRWVRKSTKKRKRSEAKEILDAWQNTADRAAAGNLDQARIREIVFENC